MAKLKLENEWKMWAAFAGLFIIIAVYLYFVSRPPMEGGEYLWKVTRIVDAVTTDLRGSGSNIRLKLLGIRVPQSQEEAAKDYLAKTVENQWVRVKVVKEGSNNVKEGFIYLAGDDIVSRMVRQGLAEVDKNETAFDIRNYIELEQDAKREKKGLWHQTDKGAK